MQTISFLAGTNIDNAAQQLVANAPARADFNGVRIRARYATTKPRDVVDRYHRLLAERHLIYIHSAKGKRAAEEDKRDITEKQSMLDSLLSNMPDFDNIGAVLAWVESAVDPADRVGVVFDRDALRAAFAAGGWGTNVNCGKDFDESDARNFAGWIVDQWLSCGYPVVRFIEQWRERFGRCPGPATALLGDVYRVG